jgi:hypothetical protein
MMTTADFLEPTILFQISSDQRGRGDDPQVLNPAGDSEVGDPPTGGRKGLLQFVQHLRRR